MRRTAACLEVKEYRTLDDTPVYLGPKREENGMVVTKWIRNEIELPTVITFD